jgi:hypothetical protein
MTRIVASRFGNAADFRRWLPTGCDGACPMWILGAQTTPHTSSFGVMGKDRQRLLPLINGPVRCSQPHERRSATPSAAAKSP